MSETNKNNSLFSEFPPVTTQQWEERIMADLKGADYEKSLVWKTLEGFKVKPYYRAEDLQAFNFTNAKPAEFPFVRGSKTISNEWEIRENISVVSIEEANKLALDALSKGATSLNFVIECESTKRAVNSQADFSALLKGIAFDCIELNFSGYHIAEEFTKYIKAEAKTRNYSKSQLRGSFRIDPLGQLISSGRTTGEPIEQIFDELTEQVKYVHEVLPGFRIVSVNGQYYGNNGATVVQELAFTLSQANEYLAQFTKEGVKIDELAPRMELQFSVSGNYFMEIAKIRAARMLWAIIIDKYAAECNCSKVIYISSVTTKWNKTAYDPYVNMLRATTEAMSAILGGTDSLVVHPFNANFNKPNEFSRRIARNIQNILKEEAYLDKIVDPAAGSYYIENLTASLVSEAWKLFVEVENQGGFLAAIKKHFIQFEVKKTAESRLNNISTRQEILLGVNQYPNFSEFIADAIDADVYDKHKPVKDLMVVPLARHFAAENFEALRLATEKSGKRPVVQLLPMGNLAMRKARSMFATNFFACAGYEVIDNNGFATVEEGAKAALEAKANIVVLCSSDEEYAEMVPKALELLSGKTEVVLAGFPKDMVETFKQAGLKHFIHMRSNVLETLQEFHKLLGIKF